jgi:hypothetical protein
MGNVTVTPGTLPLDGERVFPYVFLPEFVRTTVIDDIPSSAFLYGNLNFVQSQTDPPVDAERGRIWFERGTGKLYINETFDRGGTAGTDPWFVQMAPGREMLVLAKKDTFILNYALRPDNAGSRENFYVNDKDLQTPRMLAEISTSYSGGEGQWPLFTLVGNTQVTSAGYPSGDYWVMRGVERGRCVFKSAPEGGSYAIGHPAYNAHGAFETGVYSSLTVAATSRLQGWVLQTESVPDVTRKDIEVYKVPTADRFKQTDLTL